MCWFHIVFSFIVVSLTYEISGRPEAIRPIPGETVVFTCEVEGQTLTWGNVAFQPPMTISFISRNNPVGNIGEETNTGVC